MNTDTVPEDYIISIWANFIFGLLGSCCLLVHHFHLYVDADEFVMICGGGDDEIER